MALDVAHALAYLHEQCTPKVLHRDVKPTGTIGNVAPDYATTCRVSEKADGQAKDVLTTRLWETGPHDH
ncbi:hypothetical protein Gotur_008361, partial [Gossypium turneri]